MKILSALLATFLYSANAIAALEFTFSGDFVNFTSGNFSGQLTFDVLSPDYNDSAPGDLRLIYSHATSSSVLVNSQPFAVDNHDITLYLFDNASALTEEELASRGLTGVIEPKGYDTVTVSMASSNNQYYENGLVSGAEFSLTAFFRQDTFDATDLETHNYQDLLGLPEPQYLVFEINRKLGDATDFRGVGVVTAKDFRFNPSPEPVPLPGAVWLFGSVIAGLGLRMRKQA
ncbi:hypothetical protein [Methylomonas rosea]|uniref:PEP-CTERM sorting domain-containing protein n=1 Tax=Methylomonas rosea TaxID=2952227 RepID=A0ABT1TSZ1_9GAMM|nr:hypothetical protein [Methylomonas sp. WSC-7]MCQ8117466.1 hypothetical protein [Methylomonas sp. WSC-7]